MKPYPKNHFQAECCQEFFFPGNEHGVLLLHGFTGSVAHMRPLGNALRDKGYSVRGINLPGHALDEKAMGETNGEQWLAAAKEAAYDMQGMYKTLTVCGFSMGGALALLVAEEMKLDACATISAPMAVKNKLMALAGVIAPLYPRVAWRVRDDEAEQLDAAYDYRYSGFPTAKAADLNRLIGEARKGLSAIHCPMLCIQSGADETIWEKSADYILNGVSSTEKEKVWLEGVPHTCVISKEFPTILTAVERLLRRVESTVDNA